jgi:hypothetical protein
VYAYVPKLIEYYLGEKPLLADVPTYLCGILNSAPRCSTGWPSWSASRSTDTAATAS